MSALKKNIDKKSLRNFLPLDKLSLDKLDELLDKSIVEDIPAGRVLFRQGEKDKRNIYLLEGQVELQVTGNTKAEVVKARTLEAKYPLADTLPRPSTCRARSSVTILVVDTDHLEILLEHDPSGTYEVTELGMDSEGEDSTDWMLRFLQSRAFLQLPTANIQGLLMRLKERPVKRGEIVLQQGSQDDYYYIVKQGKCAVSRRPAPKAEDIRLAILSVGDGFGEEALITNGKRNATVTMQEDGVLMQLHKKDFMTLLVEPLLRYIDLGAATVQTKQHATLIDVRTNKAFTENGLEHANNIPLSMLRVKLGTLNPTSDYIVYCDDGSQSAAAAFLMIQQGLNCKVVRNGLGKQSDKAIPEHAQQQAPADNVVAIKNEAPDQAPAKPAKADPDQVKFEQHRRLAQEEARKAKAAEDARKAAESKTQQLKEEADKLRLQAERLATKTASAESARKQAEAEISRIKSDADGMRQQAAKDSHKMRQEAEQLRLQAEQELAKIQHEASSIQSQQDAIEKAAREAAQLAEQKTKEAEQAQRQAKAEANRVRAEAESIRQSAMQEAERLKQEMSQARKNAAKLEAEEATRREAELIAARQRADLAIQQATQAVEDARQQAALEAETIRQKAYEEAERTRREAEVAAKNAAKQADAQQREQQLRLEAARRQAEANLRETSLAAEKARRQAEQEADQIRQEAIQEAEQLRRDMESTRKLVEEEAARAKARIHQDSQRQLDAEKHRREIAAQQQAEAATRLEAEAQQQAEAARLEAEAQQQAKKAAHLEQLAVQEKAEKARHLAASQQQDENHARHLAEAIMQKLAEAEHARKSVDPEANEGLHLAKASIRRVKDRTILEGDEDIFIFKEPKAHDLGDDDNPFEDESPKQNRHSTATGRAAHDDDDLPSFIVEPKDNGSGDSPLIPELRVNISSYEHNTVDNGASKNSRKQIYALAASITLMIGIGVFSFNSQSPDPLEKLATVSQPAKANATAAENINTNNMASFAAGTSANKKKTGQKAEWKVKKLLSRWKDQLLDKPRE